MAFQVALVKAARWQPAAAIAAIGKQPAG